MTGGRHFGIFLFAVAMPAIAVPAASQTKPKPPKLTIEPISARNLLAPAEPAWSLSLTREETAGRSDNYRLRNDAGFAAGQRARLSIELGDTTLFAMTGKLNRAEQARPAGPLDAPQANVLSQRKGSSKVYGAGLERAFGKFEIGASYQYGRVTPERSHSDLKIDNPRSHSVRATARIRFRH